MKDSKDGRGSLLTSSWQELKRGGGAAPTESAIINFLEGGDSLLSHDEVVARLTAYFKGCTRQVEIDNDVVTQWATPPTKGGLAMALGVSTETLIHYIKGVQKDGSPLSDKPNVLRRIGNEDLGLVRRAVNLCEMYYEGILTSGSNPTGAIFWLLNSKSDRWTNDHSQKEITIYHEKRTPEQIAAAHGVIVDQAPDPARLPKATFIDSDISGGEDDGKIQTQE